MQKPTKNEIDIVNRLKIKVKVFETIASILSLFTLVLSQFEYELEYYEAKYVCTIKCERIEGCNKDEECPYYGQPVRIVISLAVFCLIFLTIYVSYLNYVLKREQKQIIACKYLEKLFLILIFYIFQIFLYFQIFF